MTPYGIESPESESTVRAKSDRFSEAGSEAESASGVDMSEAAVTLRIRRVADLRDLCLRLGRARPLGPVE